MSEQWRFVFYLYFSVLLNKTHVTDDLTIVKNKLFFFIFFFFALYIKNILYRPIIFMNILEEEFTFLAKIILTT